MRDSHITNGSYFVRLDNAREKVASSIAGLKTVKFTLGKRKAANASTSSLGQTLKIFVFIRTLLLSTDVDTNPTV